MASIAHGPRRHVSPALLLGQATLCLLIMAAPVHASSSNTGLITRITDLWNLSESARAVANPVRLTVTVNYYDPSWGLLWVQDEKHGLFGAPKPPFPVLKPGQQIELEARTRAGARDVNLSNATYRVISENGFPTPRIVAAQFGAEPTPDNVWAQVEGYVRRQRFTDDTHQQFEIVAGPLVVRAFGLVATNDRPELENARVRVRGVLISKYDRNQTLLDMQLMVPGIEQIELLEPLASNARFQLPLHAIASLYATSSNKSVRISGLVRNQEPGRSVVIQDATGRVLVETWQTKAFKSGTPVEAVGRMEMDGPALRLRNGLVRPVAVLKRTLAPEISDDGAEPLLFVDQLRQLSPEEAAKGRPVKITGVVTWADPTIPKLFVQDSSGGVSIVLDNTKPERHPDVGDWLEVMGNTGETGYSPVILNARLSGRGRLKMPEAQLISLEHAMTGVEDSQWVEMRGYVRSVTNAPGLARIEVATSSGSFIAHMRTESRLRELPGAIIRLRGVCAAISNKRRQLTGVELWVPSMDEIIIEEEALPDPFVIPLRTIGSLRQFSTSSTLNRRTRISGVITLNARRYLYLQDGMDSMLILTDQSNGLPPGDHVEAVGFPGREGGRLVLRDAIFRKTSGQAEPRLLKVASGDLINEEHEGRLAWIEGIVLQQTHTAEGMELTARNQQTIFKARLEAGSPTNDLPLLAAGTRVALTGVYRIQSSENQKPESFEIHLRAPSDLAVLQRPSWWTPRRAAGAMAVAFALVLAGLGWAAILTRKNAALQVQIRERQRAESELQRAQHELEHRVQERTAELSRANADLKSEVTERKRAQADAGRAHQQLMEAARQAGMAEVATSVLHNVGNVLNSVNVSATLVAEGLKTSRVNNIDKIARLLDEHREDMTEFLRGDPRGRQLPDYLGRLAHHLSEERALLLREVQTLTDNITHIKEIVSMQQSYATVSGVAETMDPVELVENALLMHAEAFRRHGIRVQREFSPAPLLTLEKHKLLQILINLIHNAKYACSEAANDDKQIWMALAVRDESRLIIEVRDNGVGIPAENLTRIFSHGFTTRKNGHGFGLHSSALAARELGGSLVAHSDGPNQGAVFTLELPLTMDVPARFNGKPHAAAMAGI